MQCLNCPCVTIFKLMYTTTSNIKLSSRHISSFLAMFPSRQIVLSLSNDKLLALRFVKRTDYHSCLAHLSMMQQNYHNNSWSAKIRSNKKLITRFRTIGNGLSSTSWNYSLSCVSIQSNYWLVQEELFFSSDHLDVMIQCKQSDLIRII